MGLHYDGLIFEDYFNDSIISTEYLDINDYLNTKYKIEYVDNKSLFDQYKDVVQKQRSDIIEAFYNILYLSHYSNQEIHVNGILNKIKNFLARLNFKVIEQEHVGVEIYLNNKIGEGFYCKVFKVSEGILKKQLKKEYLSNEKICKRFKYEYDMMLKLKDCSKIVKVYEYNEKEKSYTMEECDECLYDYLNSYIDIELSKKVKIIEDILEAIDYAHKHNIIHRDLHLGNVIRHNDEFLVCDFGLGKDKDVIKSLITSATPKNSHWFLDPIGLQDFTQLDEYSDIYSIGRMIDYIMCNGFMSENHIFSYVVSKCTSRNKLDRYKSIEEIKEDINKYLKGNEETLKQEEIDRKIEKGLFDIDAQEYIIQLTRNNKLCNYIVNHQSDNIYKIIVHIDEENRMLISIELLDKFAASTGYGHWSNYSLFGQLAYNLYKNEKDSVIKKNYYEIIKECAKVRFDIKDLLDQLV